MLSEEQEKETEVGQLFDPLTSEADPDSHMTVDEEEEMTPHPQAVNKQGDQVLDLTDSEDGDMDNGPFDLWNATEPIQRCWHKESHAIASRRKIPVIRAWEWGYRGQGERKVTEERTL